MANGRDGGDGLTAAKAHNAAVALLELYGGMWRDARQASENAVATAVTLRNMLEDERSKVAALERELAGHRAAAAERRE